MFHICKYCIDLFVHEIGLLFVFAMICEKSKYSYIANCKFPLDMTGPLKQLPNVSVSEKALDVSVLFCILKTNRWAKEG